MENKFIGLVSPGLYIIEFPPVGGGINSKVLEAGRNSKGKGRKKKGEEKKEEGKEGEKRRKKKGGRKKEEKKGKK